MSKTLLLLFSFFCLPAFSQTMHIAGNVQDTISKTGLQNATVTVIRIKDSIMIDFARTNSKGFFEFNNLPIDTVQVTVSYPKAGDQMFYVFGSKENNSFDFGKIVLPPKSQNLNEVIIYAFKDPVYYKGDTLVYTADSFKVKPNATVEDLLKKLPGIKVDAQGKITSQGKTISEVLVDGDEFFGSDPTVATKNLAAKGVESVQVYEKKNENAAEGGDETIQVMNLQLKEEAKKGYFGKVSGASDFQKFYEGELLMNKFKGAQKISVFTLTSNTPRSNFGWGDSYKYGLENESGMSSNEDGDNMYWMNGGGNQNQGVPQTLKSGIYYNDKLESKTKLGLNYSYNKKELKAVSSEKSQYFLQDTSYITNNENENLEKSEGHSINMKITQTLDSLTDLIIEPKLNLNNSRQTNSQLTKFTTVSDTLTHKTDVLNTNNADGYTLNSSAKLKRKFKKKDRLLLVNYNYTVDDNKSLGVLKSFNTFYNSTNPNDSINQQKINTNNTQTHNANVVYTEPLTKKIKLEFDYIYNYSVGKQNKKAQNFRSGEYSLYDSTLSNNFENTKITNRLGLKFIYEAKKQSFNFGSRFRNVDITNSILISQKQVKQSVNNILPFLGYMYKFNQNARFNFKYKTSSNQPSINQLQPVPDNSNPNQIRLGNPDLLPTFEQDFSASLNSHKPISGKYMWASLNYSTTNNDFANSTVYDNLGRTITKTVNVNDNYNASGNISGGLPMFSRKLSINPSASISYNNYSSFVNSQKNTTTTLNPNFGLGVDVNIDTLTFSISYNYDYNMPSSTLSNESNKPYAQHQFDASLNLKLPFKFWIDTDAKYLINSKRAAGYNINYFIWNVSINKAFLKNENFILSVSGNDILNQNISTSRDVQGNVITDNKTNIISRYFLLKLTYKFNSTNTKENDNMW